MISFSGALYFQSAHCRDWWHKWGDDWVSGPRCLDACLCCLVYSHWICLSEKFASYFESCSFTFFVSLQEEETPLSAGLLSLHVHGTVYLRGVVTIMKRTIWETHLTKNSVHLPKLSLDIPRHSQTPYYGSANLLKHSLNSHFSSSPLLKHSLNTHFSGSWLWFHLLGLSLPTPWLGSNPGFKSIIITCSTKC